MKFGSIFHRNMLHREYTIPGCTEFCGNRVEENFFLQSVNVFPYFLCYRLSLVCTIFCRFLYFIFDDNGNTHYIKETGVITQRHEQYDNSDDSCNLFDLVIKDDNSSRGLASCNTRDLTVFSTN